MRIIKNLQVVEDDWTLLRGEPEDGVWPDGPLIVPWALWGAHSAALRARGISLAPCLGGADALEELVPELPQLSLIALDFPVFVDGRSYSHARLLRGRYQYQGELRAVGDVLRDQLYFMRRCGIGSFELRPDQDADAALQAFGELTVKYQAAADGAPPLYRYR